jgi:ferredoxin--NADP+ reductase
MSSRYTTGTLIERVDFSEDLAMFRFETEDALDFTPGQYATLGLEVDGRKILRPYSVVSAPHEPFMEFFLELVPDGALSQQLWKMDVSDTVLIRNRVVGRFTLDDEHENRTHHLMTATVTGIAPYISMIRHQQYGLAEGFIDEPQEMLILQGASYAREFGLYGEELEKAAAVNDWLTYVRTISRPWEDDMWEGEVGRVEDVVRKYADTDGYDYESAIAYTCGHPQMIEKVKNILRRARFDDDYIREEKYFID